MGTLLSHNISIEEEDILYIKYYRTLLHILTAKEWKKLLIILEVPNELINICNNRINCDFGGIKCKNVKKISNWIINNNNNNLITYDIANKVKQNDEELYIRLKTIHDCTLVLLSYLNEY